MADYYQNSGGESGADANPGAEAPDNDTPSDEQDEGQTALLPKDIFGDEPPQPGDTCTFKVVHVYDDEVEVQYVDKDEDGGAEDQSAMGKADSQLAGMGSPPGGAEQ